MGVIHRCYRSRLCHTDTSVRTCFNSPSSLSLSLFLSISISPSLFLFTHSHSTLWVSLCPCQRTANKEEQADNVRGWGNCSPLLPLSLLPPSLFLSFTSCLHCALPHLLPLAAHFLCRSAHFCRYGQILIKRISVCSLRATFLRVGSFSRRRSGQRKRYRNVTRQVGQHEKRKKKKGDQRRKGGSKQVKNGGQRWVRRGERGGRKGSRVGRPHWRTRWKDKQMKR